MIHKAIVFYTDYSSLFEISKKGYVLLVIKPQSIFIYTPLGIQIEKVTIHKTSEMIAKAIVKQSTQVKETVMNVYTHTMGEYDVPKAVPTHIARRVLRRYGFGVNDLKLIDTPSV